MKPTQLKLGGGDVMDVRIYNAWAIPATCRGFVFVPLSLYYFDFHKEPAAAALPKKSAGIILFALGLEVTWCAPTS